MTAMPRGYSARQVAARVVARSLDGGAFAAAVLDSELEKAVQLDGRDRALATELVYGCLRVEPWLEGEIERFTRTKGAKDSSVRAHLVVAAFQLFFTRVPPFAAVSEAVSSVRAERGPKVGAFANAVLRRVAMRAAMASHPSREEAAFASTPTWLRESLERSLSLDGAREFLKAGGEPPSVALRLEHAGERLAWLTRLRETVSGAKFEPGRLSPMCILVRGAGNPESLPGYDEGAWSVQEEGAQLAALAVGAQEGDFVLDACAGRGNKTAVLARAVGPTGAVDACDLGSQKLERLQTEFRRLGLHVRDTFSVDWTVGSGEVKREYAHVLVDAPCTGVGTVRRRPEIALRRGAKDLQALAQTQKAIICRAAEHVRKGGTLLYVVCSILREECEEVIREVLAERPELEPASFDVPAMREWCGDASSVRLLPNIHGTDGYFLARLRRRA